MNCDDEYQAWLEARRSEAPTSGLTDRIMATVRVSVADSGIAARSEFVRRSAIQRALPYLVCSAAALILALRLYSFASIFVIAPSMAEIAMNEPVEEVSNVRNP